MNGSRSIFQLGFCIFLCIAFSVFSTRWSAPERLCRDCHKMVSVEKCCGFVKLSTGGIILGCFGAFSSFLLIIVIGGFLLNYDNFVAQSYAKGSHGDEDSKKIAMFLETYKNGKDWGRCDWKLTFFYCSCPDGGIDVSSASGVQLCQFTFSCLRIHSCESR